MNRRTPDWEVTSVFDPDGAGQDFSYTVGLHERGLPELHVWGRPSIGDDPGADWLFSPTNRSQILDDTAWRLVDGDLKIGDEWESPYDSDFTRVRFRLDPPGSREELQALGIAPDAEVLPVRWSLHRRAIGRPKPLKARALQRATSEYADLLAGLGDDVAVPEGWSLPPDFEPGGPFGPLTPMVAGRVAQLWAADPTQLSNLLWADITANQGGPSTGPAGVAHAAARELGRVDEVAKTAGAAVGVVEALMALPDWSEVLQATYDAVGFDEDEATLAQFERSWRHRTTGVLWSVLGTEVVADRLTAQQRLDGRGVWLVGLGPVGELPGRQWRAPRAVLDRLLKALWPLGFEEVLVVISRHMDPERTDYRRLSDVVHGWSITSAAGCPWEGVLDQLPSSVLPGRITSLQEWATIMTSAACHRERLSAADVAVLCAPFLDLVPELPTVIAG